MDVHQFDSRSLAGHYAVPHRKHPATLPLKYKRRGTDNKRVCRFFTWFWFSLSNRETIWPRHVVRIYSPFDMLVEGCSSRQHVWLRGEGVEGYEVSRTLFRHLGRWLLRFERFRKWNVRACECGHTCTWTKYHDSLDGHTTCEILDVCARCNRPAYEFAYGSHNDYWSTPWERLEVKVFGWPDKRQSSK